MHEYLTWPVLLPLFFLLRVFIGNIVQLWVIRYNFRWRREEKRTLRFLCVYDWNLCVISDHAVLAVPFAYYFTLQPRKGMQEMTVNHPKSSTTFFFFFTTVLSQWDFPPWEIRVAFPGKSQLRRSRNTQLTVHAGCFNVSMIPVSYTHLTLPTTAEV